MKKRFMTCLVLLVCACGEKKQKQEVITVEAEVNTEQPDKIALSQRTAEINDTAVAQIYDAYASLKNALVNTDAEAAKTAGERLLKVTSAQNMSDKSLNEGLEAVTGSNAIGKQREQFPAITAAVKKLLDGEIASGSLYYQYCPMAFSGKGGYWISNDKAIHNPYFGNKMMDCGTVEEEIR